METKKVVDQTILKTPMIIITQKFRKSRPNDEEIKKDFLTTNVAQNENELKVLDEIVVHATAIFKGTPAF